MLPFEVYVKIGDEVFDLMLLEPGDCSVVSIINDAKKELNVNGIKPWEKWQLSITFPWNGYRHVLLSDEDLMFVFEEYNKRNISKIMFDLQLMSITIEHAKPTDGMLTFNEPSTETEPHVETVRIGKQHAIETEPAVNVEASDSEGDEDYEIDYQSMGESTDVSNLSLMDDESEDADIDYCDPNGKDMVTILSSDEDDNGIARMARYCCQHQWALNPDGSISLREGHIFGNAKLVRDVVKQYAIQEGFELKKVKNDLCRYTVTCKNATCDWRVHVSRLPDGVTFEVKSITGGHIMCPRVAKNKEANANWVASVLGRTIEANPHITLDVLKNEVHERFAVDCDLQVIYRAKKQVLKNLKKDHVKSYAKVRKYANMILKMNSESCAKVLVDHSISCSPRFQRFFLSFNAHQTGFTRGCRPFIGVDGCHLTSPFQGVMLSAVALDGDSRIFPIAICICEIENTDTWTWFLRLLKECLGWNDRRPICFMSDRQKGCISALAKEWPYAGKRYYFRHMLANFTTVFKNDSINAKLWAAAKASNVADFKAILEDIKEDSYETYKWLVEEEPVDKWARHAFDEQIVSDHITNNLSESFNKWVKEERKKPILTLLEHLRRRYMVNFCNKYDEIDKMTENITPYARRVLNKNDKEARKLKVVHGKGQWYETIETGYKRILVSIDEKTCDCGEWQISGLPCKHVIAVLIYRKELPHDYVHWYYTKEAMQLTYSGSINPIPNEGKWPAFESKQILPPQIRAKVGRPKKARRRAPDKGRAASSKTWTGRCKICKKLGHNSRTCPTKEKKPALKKQGKQLTMKKQGEKPAMKKQKKNTHYATTGATVRDSDIRPTQQQSVNISMQTHGAYQATSSNIASSMSQYESLVQHCYQGSTSMNNIEHTSSVQTHQQSTRSSFNSRGGTSSNETSSRPSLSQIPEHCSRMSPNSPL